MGIFIFKLIFFKKKKKKKKKFKKKKNFFKVPGYLSKNSSRTERETNKKESSYCTTSDKNKTSGSFYQHRFREETKSNWLGENFKFGFKPKK